MANELKIIVKFDNKEAITNINAQTDAMQRQAYKAEELAQKFYDYEDKKQKALEKSEQAALKQETKIAKLSQAQLSQQEKELAALQAYLGKKEQATQKEIELEVRKYAQRRKSIEIAELQSAAELKLIQQYGISTRMSGNASMTLQALNYTIRDSAYFSRDLALGLLAVGNNLNPLIDGFIRVKGELKEGQSLWGALTSSMSKAQWTILGFSFAVSMIQAITFELAKNKSEAKTSAETISQLAEEYRTLSEKLQQAKKEALNLNG